MNSMSTLEIPSFKNHQQRRGTIEMIIGPMFAGKSTELIRKVKRHEISGKRCLYVKYLQD
jgi:thymidine kinase